MKGDVWLVDVVEKGDFVTTVAKGNDGEEELVLVLTEVWGPGRRERRGG
jgi:hypothetical protein